METNISNPNKSHNGKTMAGIIIVIIGGLLLMDQLNIFFVPEWLFSWPMLIIGYGLYMGAKYNFRKPFWVWMIFIGTAFLLTENIDNSERLVWPIGIIGVGAWMVMKHNNKQANAPYTGTDYKEV
jgi:hypothetical protein